MIGCRHGKQISRDNTNQSWGMGGAKPVCRLLQLAFREVPISGKVTESPQLDVRVVNVLQSTNVLLKTGFSIRKRYN